MADLITAANASEAWLGAMELMLSGDGKAVNLGVSFPCGADGNERLVEMLDEFLSEQDIRDHGELLTVQTVANTIFPEALYHPHLGSDAAAHLYKHYELSMRIHRRRKGDKETYFNRLVAYPVGAELAGEGKGEFKVAPDGSWNQLAYYVERLRSQHEKGHLSSAYELGVSHPLDGELRIQAPFRDKKIGSFPCLSHISLTLADGKVHMSAVYRNHYFISRAYGNYLGLARLLQFVANETGAAPGELLVLATHGDAEAAGRAQAVRGLLERSRTRLAQSEDRESSHVG